MMTSQTTYPSAANHETLTPTTHIPAPTYPPTTTTQTALILVTSFLMSYRKDQTIHVKAKRLRQAHVVAAAGCAFLLRHLQALWELSLY
jgi:hypothetical protein